MSENERTNDLEIKNADSADQQKMKTIQTRSVFLCGRVVNRIYLQVPTALLAMFFVTSLWTFDAHAQGLIWNISSTSYVGNEAGAGPVSNREMAFDHISDRDFPLPPSQNSASGIFSMTISTNDAGRTFFANAVNEPGFNGFVAGLTDGANGYIRLQEAGSSTWGVGSEANVLGRSPGAPDLAGYDITQIGFRINNYYDWFYAPENRYLNTLEYSLEFYGTPVPEPSTWALITLAGAAALLIRRKARRLPRP